MAKRKAPNTGGYVYIPSAKQATEWRLKNLCAGCGGVPPHDTETGFTARFCSYCEKLPQFKPDGKPQGDSGWRKKHRKEGIQNLDRLTKDS
jgi:hypothetical protein